ncbi:uncharacterized protein [Leptinotarsa decemlineata]|uniref:uncharacterized protein n=1 Tax=Leptinotarsa decemlineata TaxID=7539 RepID=UPI003D30BCB7
MGFFEEIEHNYGFQISRAMKEWNNTNKKLASYRNRRIFLLQCRKNNVVPSHIENNTKNLNILFNSTNGKNSYDIHNFNDNLKKKILNLEIKITHNDLKNLENISNKQTKFVTESIPINIWLEFEKRQTIKYNKIFNDIKKKNIDKLNILKMNSKSDIKTKENWIKNLSDIIIPEDIKHFLALGFNFSLPPTTTEVNIPNLLSDIENLITGFCDSKKNLFRAKITNIVTNFFQKPHDNKNYLNFLFEKTKTFLKNHPELILTRSDKGNVTVIMKKSDYIEKSLEIINDSESYVELNRDPVSTIQQKANKIITDLKKSEMISEDEAKTYMIYNSISPKYYGLSKIHKPDLKLRPIISSIDAPNSKIAQMITKILTDENEFYIKDSFDFSNFINEKSLPPGYILISLDVISLFSNIPMNLVEKSIIKRWNDINKKCSINQKKNY